jgi:hypothetical protein
MLYMPVCFSSGCSALIMCRREGADGGDSKDIIGGHDIMGMLTFGFSHDPEKKKIVMVY